MSDFFKDGGPVLAGSIAYFFLLSFVPFCLLLFSLFGYFLGENREFFQFFTARLLRFFPAATSEISKQLTALVVDRQIGIFTLVLYLFYTSSTWHWKQPYGHLKAEGGPLLAHLDPIFLFRDHADRNADSRLFCGDMGRQGARVTLST